MKRGLVVLAVALPFATGHGLAACGAPHPPDDTRTIPTSKPMPSGRTTASTDAEEPCVRAEWQAVTLPAGEHTSAGDGLEVAFDGGSFDHFVDGSFDLRLSFRLFRRGDDTSWQPSFRQRYPSVLLEHCVRLVEAVEDRVVLEVAPLPSAPASP